MATYARGKKRLDYAIATSTVAKAFKQGGYEPFAHRFISDHRAFYLDFDTQQLFGNPTGSLSARAYRDIDSKSPTQVTRYLEHLHTLLPSRNLLQRAETLAASSTPNHLLAEQLQQDLTNFCVSAGKQCHTLREPQWSAEIATLRNQIGVLKRVITSYRTGRNMTIQIQRILDKYGKDYLVPDTMQECKARLRQLQRTVRDVAYNSVVVRNEERDRRVAQLEASTSLDSRKQAIYLRNLRKAEEQKWVYTKIRQLKGTTNGNINSLKVPEDSTQDPKRCTNWRTVNTPAEIVRYLRERNQKHFGQAQGTPWTVPPISQSIDFCASTTTTELVLDGNYKPEEITHVSQLLVDHLKQNTADKLVATQMEAQLTEAELIGKLKSRKENTSTNPEGLHLGHWHAMIARHTFTDLHNEDSERLDLVQEHLRRICIALTNYGVKWEYSHTQWKSIVSCMIPKEPGNNKIHRLRVIHLYDTGYNLYLSVKWRSLMDHTEDSGTLNPGTYGSRANRTAMTPPLMEELMNEISRTSRKPMIKFDNDATSCYDRILPAMASIASQKFGAPRGMTMVMARTLEEARYKLKTQMGISKEFYSHCIAFPIYGTGQGSGNSPVIWCFMSSILFDCYDSVAHGSTFESPDKRTSIKIYMVGFVDDTTGQVNQFHSNTPPTPEQLSHIMQQDAQLWNDLLWASGGALELPKCSYHVVYWQFSADGTPSLVPGTIQPHMHIQSGDRTHHEIIKPISAYTSHKTLGHHKSLSGNQTTQYQVLKTKSDDIGRFVRSSPLNRSEAWTHYFSTDLTSVGYPLPNCHFSYKQLDTLQRSATNAIIAKCGYNRNTHRSIIYGPTSLGGASFWHLYTVQGIGQITTFLSHWRTQGQATSLLQIALAWAQYSLGTGTSCLHDVRTVYPHNESKWIASLRQYLNTIDGQMWLDATGVQPLQREHDTYIMDHVLLSTTFKPHQVWRINYCRLYLQALTVSDISDATGTHITAAALYGVRAATAITSNHYTNQDRPSEAAWQSWRKAYKLISSNTTMPGKARQLHQGLGAWKVPSSQIRSKWNSYFSPHENILYVRAANEYIRYHVESSQTTEQCIAPCGEPPNHAYPCEVQDCTTSWLIVGTSIPPRVTPPPTPSTTFAMHILTLAPWEQQLFHTMHFETDMYELSEILSQQRFVAASDGSVKENSGSFGWIIGTRNGKRLVTCAGPAFGSNLSSYRAEGYGMLSILRFLVQLSIYCNTTSLRRCTLHCDNQSLVNNVNNLQCPRTTPPSAKHNGECGLPLSADWDVIQAITKAQSNMTAPARIQHIKSHQDNDKPYHELPLSAQLNVDADHLAGEFQTKHGRARLKVPPIEGTKAQLTLSTGTITSNYQATIRYSATHTQLKTYIQHRTRWDDHTMDGIDWNAHGFAIKRATHKCHTLKLVHDILPVNTQTSRFGQYHESTCHQCHCHDEDRDHIIKCSTASAWRRHTLQNVRKTCTAIHTSDHLLDILLDGLELWMASKIIDPGKYPTKYHRLIHEQTTIGWRQLFNGRMSKGWSYFQDRHLQQTDRQTKSCNGQLWTVIVIQTLRKNWTILWNNRNAALHGKTYTAQQSALRHKMLRHIEQIYADKHKYLSKDRQFLCDNIEDHKQQSTTSLVNWVATFLPIFAQSVISAKAGAIEGVRRIQSYFEPLRVAPPEE